MKPIAAHARRVPATKLTHNHTRSAAPHNRPCFLLPLFIMHSPYNVIVNIFIEKGEDETLQPVLQAGK